MKPLISILTPTYNHEKYISECIESIISQTYENWEQIIIDDGSQDNTANIISEFNDKRIKYIKQENLGIYNLKETYNKALSLSNGEYIAILEGDDYWPDYKLEEQIKAFQNKGVVLGCGNAQIINEKGEIENFYHKPKSNSEISSTYETLNKLLLENFIPACTVLCHKEALIKIGGFNQTIDTPYVDYPTWLKLSKMGNFYYDNEIMGYWRRHQEQISSSKYAMMYKSSLDCSIEFYDNMTNEEKKLLSIDIEDIVKFKNKTFADNYFRLGLEELHKKEWKNSRENFIKSLNGNNLIKIYAILGLFCSYLKIDLKKLKNNINQ